jgi:Zn-dependent protease
MDFIPGKTQEKGRRITQEQRERERERESNRRAGEERRGTSVARTLVYGFDALRLTTFSSIVKILVSLKLFELLTMVVSAVLTAAAYSITMKPVLAMSLVLILIVHEYGHYLAAKRCGYPPRLWLHIPFFGARMEAHEFRSQNDEAFIAYGGPLLGGICSFALFGLWLALPIESAWRYNLYVISIASAFLNLFNLIPLLPLDGGRIMHAILPRMSLAVGFAALITASYLFKEAAFLVVWILVVGYIPIKPRQRLHIACCMFVAMPILMWFGYRGAHLWEDGIYLAFGLLLVKTIHTLSSHPETVKEDKVAEMSKYQRVRWAWQYWGLVVSLSALVAAHVALFSTIK